MDEHILNNVDVRKINGACFTAVKKEVAGVTYETFKTWASGVWEVWLKQKLKAIKRKQLNRRAKTASTTTARVNLAPVSSSSQNTADLGNSLDVDNSQSPEDMQDVTTTSSAVGHQHFRYPVSTTDGLTQFTAINTLYSSSAGSAVHFTPRHVRSSGSFDTNFLSYHTDESVDNAISPLVTKTSGFSLTSPFSSGQTRPAIGDSIGVRKQPRQTRDLQSNEWLSSESSPPKRQKVEEVLVGTIEQWMNDRLLTPRCLMQLARKFNQDSQLSVGVGTASEEMVPSGSVST